MEYFGYIGGLVIGLSLGLVGGGGSILTVPVFAYLFGLTPTTATAYSLFVVGVSSGFGAFKYWRRGDIAIGRGVLFAIPATVGVYVTRRFLVPKIPEEMFTLGEVVVGRDLFIMTFFGLIVLVAAVLMIRGGVKTEEVHEAKGKEWLIVIEGLVVGGVTGLIGAGGGFLIIPALVLLAGMPIKIAIGTSLLIITAKSLIGFLGDLPQMTVDWPMLVSFTAVAVVGILAGTAMSHKISAEKLKPGFGWFLVVMGIVVLSKEILGAA